jgi:hypothetical protein
MAYEVILPKNKEQKEVVLRHIVGTGKRARHISEVNWWIAHHYLQGAREFSNVNYQQGTIDVSYINEEGVLRFRYDDVVAKFQSQLGRLMQIDMRPKTTKRSVGLEDLRKASIAQVVLDAAFPRHKVDQLKMQICSPLLKYGMLGLFPWSDEDENIGIDVGMPWEILPIPPNPLESRDIRGIIRLRTVPVDWLKGLTFAPRSDAKVWGEMEISMIPVGHVPTDSGGRFNTFTETLITGPMGTVGKSASAKHKDKTQVGVTELAEIWIERSDGYLKSYDVMAGSKLWHTQTYEGQKQYMPAQIIKDIDTGNFWGRSFVSTQIPLNTEMEYTIGRTFQNMQDLDIYGLVLEPTTLGLPTEIMRGVDGVKRVRYEPDYAVPELKPTNIAPFNAGRLPVEVVKMGAGLMDRIANQPSELLKGDAPGRVDSSSGLGFLFEVSNTPLTSTAMGIGLALSNCYKACLNLMQTQWSNEKAVEITLLDDSLAGITLDMSTGTLDLARNVVPHPDDVNVFIKAMLPKSREQEKMELMKALELQAIDMFEYRIEVRKRGLDLPVGNEAEWQNYRRAMLENLLLFGDGRAPGSVLIDEIDIPWVHLRVLQAFMARPEYFLASEAVRAKFKDHYKMHQEQMGGMPDGAPYPEEAAEEAQFQNAIAQLQAGQPPQAPVSAAPVR